MDKAPPPETVARITRWALLLFFAYAIWTGAFKVLPNTSTTGQQPPQAPETTAASQDCGPQSSPFHNFAMIASTLIPTSFPIIRTQDIAKGDGPIAVCGQKATLRYQYTLENGSLIFSNLKSGDTTHAVIGGNTLLHGLELGMLGMKPGGERKVAFPAVFAFDRTLNPAMLQNADKFALKFTDVRKSVILGQIALVGTSPQLPTSPVPLRTIERKPSNGVRAQCGDTVRTRMTIWKLDGTKFFSTDDTGTPLVFTIGESRMPFGIEQGVMGMPEGSERTIILPAAYTKPLINESDDAAAPGVGKLPEEIMMVVVGLEHIGVEAQPAKKPDAKATPDKKPDAKGSKDSDKDEDSDDK